jgi:hypothetical protein
MPAHRASAVRRNVRGAASSRPTLSVEGLFGTGLRMGEWSSQLTMELPHAVDGALLRGRLISECAKRKRGRPFWMRRRVARLVRFTWRKAAGPQRWHGLNGRAATHWCPTGGCCGVSAWWHRGGRRAWSAPIGPGRRDGAGPADAVVPGRAGRAGAGLVVAEPRRDASVEVGVGTRRSPRANTSVTKALAAQKNPVRLWCRPHIC